MTYEEVKNIRNASLSIIALADDMMGRVAANDQVIAERKLSVDATDKLSREIINVLRHAVDNSQGESESHDVRLARLVDIISSLITSLESSVRLSHEDLIRLEATQDGMRRALTAIRNEGQLKLQELDSQSQPEDDHHVEKATTSRKRPSSKIISEE